MLDGARTSLDLAAVCGRLVGAVRGRPLCGGGARCVCGLSGTGVLLQPVAASMLFSSACSLHKPHELLLCRHAAKNAVWTEQGTK